MHHLSLWFADTLFWQGTSEVLPASWAKMRKEDHRGKFYFNKAFINYWIPHPLAHQHHSVRSISILSKLFQKMILLDSRRRAGWQAACTSFCKGCLASTPQFKFFDPHFFVLVQAAGSYSDVPVKLFYSL